MVIYGRNKKLKKIIYIDSNLDKILNTITRKKEIELFSIIYNFFKIKL